MTGRRLLVALSAAVLTIGPASSALGQAKAVPAKKRPAAQARQADAGEEGKPAGGKANAAERKAVPGASKVAPAGRNEASGGRKVVRLEEMRVEGRVQKPQALFLMPRAGVSPGEQDRTESFLPEAKDAVERDPF